MKNFNVNRSRIATLVLAVLLISSTFALFTVNSQASTNALSNNLNPETGQPYGDLSQYVWQAYGADGANSRSSNGPAPNDPKLSWTQTVASTGQLTAFDGYVFVRGATTVSAYVANTGVKAWETATNGAIPGSVGAVVKISNTTCAYLATNGVVWYTTASGAASPAKSTISSTLTGSAVYDPVSHIFISTAASGVGVCINVATAGTATVAWTFNSGASSLTALAIGGGNAFFTSGSKVYAVKIADGTKAWEADKSGNAASATFVDGVLYACASSSAITAFNAASGSVLNTFNSTATFANGTAAKYGRIFSAAVGTPSWVGCWDASFEQQWKQAATYTTSNALGAVADRKLYICTNDASSSYALTAFDAFSGQKIWTKTTTTAIVAPIIAYGNLYIIDGSQLQCYSDLAQSSNDWYMFHGYNDVNGLTQTGVATGNYPSQISTPDWKFKADAPISGSPVIVSGYAYFGTFNGSIYCVDANLGTLVWRNNYNINGSVLSIRILSTPTIVNGTLYTGADDGNVYALNAYNGSQIWKTAAGGVTDMPLQKGAWQVKSSPCYYDSKVFVGAMDGYCYAFNAVTGAQLWKTSVSTTAIGIGSSPSVYRGRDGVTAVYLYANGAIKKLNIDTGSQISSTSVSSGSGIENTGSLTIYKDYLFVTSGNTANSKLTCYNATTMASLCSITFSTVTASSPMTETPTLVENQTCFVASGTNLGWQTSGVGYYRVNQTGTGNWTRTLTCLYQGEATSADCVALIKPGDDLGAAMGTSPGVSGLDQHWIFNGTAPVFLKLWSRWAGHQLYASATVALDANNPLWSPLVYIGNAAFGFTCFNGSSGEVISTYTAQGVVFSTAALANNKVYITAEDYYLACISGLSASQSFLSASSDVGATANVNQAVTITGRLLTSQMYGTSVFGPSVPYADISLVWTKPDSSSEIITAKTDSQGNFNITYTLGNTAGYWNWLVMYSGARTAYSQLAGSYSAYSTITVSTTATPTPPLTATPTNTPAGPDNTMTYVYAAVGVVVALVVVLVVVMMLRKRK